MTSFSYDPSSSSVAVETKAVGMLAKLAHDLSIDARGAIATATLANDKITVVLRAPVAELKVRGARKGSYVDESALSASDRAEIERRIREDVLAAAEVAATLSCEAASVKLAEEGRRTVPAGGSIEIGRRKADVRPSVTLQVSSARVVAEGRVTVSLPALGITPPKGPLGAFKLRDDVEVVFKLAFAVAD
jgi:hypothetical protein